jgi:hypothetical protein
MAKGHRCGACGDVMYAQDEKYEAQGTWVTYVCRNGGCASVKRGYPEKHKQFEGK